jgi:hypothetical protein
MLMRVQKIKLLQFRHDPEAARNDELFLKNDNKVDTIKHESKAGVYKSKGFI